MLRLGVHYMVDWKWVLTFKMIVLFNCNVIIKIDGSLQYKGVRAISWFGFGVELTVPFFSFDYLCVGVCKFCFVLVFVCFVLCRSFYCCIFSFYIKS